VRRVFQAFRAEAVAAWGDKGALLVLVVAVLAYAFFYPVPYLPEVLTDVPVAVVDLDHTPLSRRLVRMVDAHQLVRVTRQLDSVAEASRLVDEGSVGAVLVIPAGLERDVRRGEPTTAVAFADASYLLVYRQVATGLVEAAGTLSAGIEVARAEARGVPRKAALAVREPLGFQSRSLYNPAQGYLSYVVPSVLILILQQTLLIGIGLLAGTARGRVTTPSPDDGTPLAALASLVGRTAFYLCLYAVHVALYLGPVSHILGLPLLGKPATAAAFAVPFLLASTLMALTVSGAFRRREEAFVALLGTSIPFLFLAGFAWPAEAIPRALRLVSWLVPSTPGIAGFLRVNQMGASIAEVAPEWLALWCLAALYFLTAWAVERRRLRRTKAVVHPVT
jgi:ABC-2 type transport system permease protein